MGRYIPETQKEQEVMLEKIGLKKIDDLYSMVPEEVKLKELAIPEGKSEYEVLEEMKAIASRNTVYSSIFRGAEPWIASNIAYFLPIFILPAVPTPPWNSAASSVMISP